MKKLFILLPEDIPTYLCGRGYADAFKKAGIYAESNVYSETDDEQVIKFKPDYVMFFDFENSAEKLVKDLYKDNKNCIFVFYYLKKMTEKQKKLFEVLKTLKLKKIFLSADKEDLKISDEIIYHSCGINSIKYKTPFLGYKDRITLLANPNSEKVLKIFEVLTEYFGQINLYCDEIEYLSSLDNEYFLDFDDRLKDIYKNSYKGSLSTEKTRKQIFSSSYINVVITDTINNGVDYRILEVAASAGITFGEPLPEIDRLFDVGREVETFDSIETLVQKIEFYLEYPIVGRTIGLKGRRAVINNHSVFDRTKKIIKMMNEKFEMKAKKHE